MVTTRFVWLRQSPGNKSSRTNETCRRIGERAHLLQRGSDDDKRDVLRPSRNMIIDRLWCCRFSRSRRCWARTAGAAPVDTKLINPSRPDQDPCFGKGEAVHFSLLRLSCVINPPDKSVAFRRLVSARIFSQRLRRSLCLLLSHGPR